MGQKNRRKLALKKQTLRRLDERQLRAARGGGDAPPADQGGSNYFTCTCFCEPTIWNRNGGGLTLGG